MAIQPRDAYGILASFRRHVFVHWFRAFRGQYALVAQHFPLVKDRKTCIFRTMEILIALPHVWGDGKLILSYTSPNSSGLVEPLYIAFLVFASAIVLSHATQNYYLQQLGQSYMSLLAVNLTMSLPEPSPSWSLRWSCWWSLGAVILPVSGERNA